MLLFQLSIKNIHGLIMIERIHLQILKAVEEQGSLTSAAKALYLTQSALSHSIKKLEGQIGTQLWEKQGRNLRLTHAGEYLLTSASRILPQLERLDEQLRQFASGSMGSLKIGMECHPCYRWLMKVIEPYLQQWPEVDLDVKQRFQFGGMAALHSHDIDILVTPDPLKQREVDYVRVFDYEQMLVVGGSHPFSELDFVEPQQLQDQQLYCYPVEPSRLDIYSHFLMPAGIQPRKHNTVESTDLLLQLVAANRGVAALPGWLIEECQRDFDVLPLRLGQKGIPKSIYLGIHSNRVAEPVIENFLKLAKADLDQS